MNETSKAMRRRWIEEASGGFKWSEVFKGRGVDVGCGPNKLPFDDCIGFDMEDGDANKLHAYFPAGHFDYLHASQCLEHMIDVQKALASWIDVVKLGGWLVITIPDLQRYEGMRFPSVFNPDHKSTWSMDIETFDKSSQHIFVPDLVKNLEGLGHTATAKLVDTNYDYAVGASKDQTWEETDGVEAFIEIVIQKQK